MRMPWGFVEHKDDLEIPIIVAAEFKGLTLKASRVVEFQHALVKTLRLRLFRP